jgi:hypothetical protein
MLISKWLVLPLMLLFCAPSAYAMESCAKGKTITTRDVRVTASKGVRIHTAVYSDGSKVVTNIDGREAGKQVVTANGKVIGISYDISFRAGYFRHKHSWGEVLSYPLKQVVKFN